MDPKLDAIARYEDQLCIVDAVVGVDFALLGRRRGLGRREKQLVRRAGASFCRREVVHRCAR